MVGCHNEQRAGPPAAAAAVVWDPLKKSHNISGGVVGVRVKGEWWVSGARAAAVEGCTVAADADEEVVDGGRRRAFYFFVRVRC